MITRTQLSIAGLMMIVWFAGCTAGQAGGQNAGTVPPPAAVASLVPCSTATAAHTSPLPGTVPLSQTSPLTTTPGLTDTQLITIVQPITLTPPISGTVVATGTLHATPPISATGTTQPGPTATTIGSPPSRGTVPSGTATPAPSLTAPPPTPVAPPATATRPPTATATPLSPATATPSATATALPPASPTPLDGPPTETATPAPVGTVYLRSHRGFGEGDDYVVVGEVLNATSAAIFHVRIVGTFYNASGQTVATQEGYTFLVQTSPDQRNPFKLRVANPANDISTYELAISWEEISVVSYQDIIILSQAMDENNGPSVAGEVQNDFGENLGSVVITVALYDEAGEVVDVYQGTPRATQLAPGEVTPYLIAVTPGVPIASFQVQAQGKRAIFF